MAHDPGADLDQLLLQAFRLVSTDYDSASLIIGPERTDHATYCPYKGDCTYFSIPLGGNRSTNAVWSYEAPYAPVAPIRDYLAFYPGPVDAIEERPEA